MVKISLLLFTEVIAGRCNIVHCLLDFDATR